jgi:hypothetical protein
VQVRAAKPKPQKVALLDDGALSEISRKAAKEAKAKQ